MTINIDIYKLLIIISILIAILVIYLIYTNSYELPDTKTTVILFELNGCKFCEAFKPTWDKISEIYNEKFNFVVYEANKDPEQMKKYRYKIVDFPTVLVKYGSNIIPYNGSYMGDSSFGDLSDFLNKF